MKFCLKCETNKELSDFNKDKKRKDGLNNKCRNCKKQEQSNYYKSKAGRITRIYGNQKENSRTRGHKPPTYTKQQFSEWMQSQPLFHKLYDEWLDSGCLKDMSPSVDRLDDNKGYSLDNIQLMTWAENDAKGSVDHKSGKNNYDLKAVSQFALDGIFIEMFISASEAGRRMNINNSDISSCCRGDRDKAGGFIWKYD